jgi:hypothetical protein
VILSFNLGVELGQIAALLVMTAVLAIWRQRENFTRFSAQTNQALVATGLLLFLMQLHGYTHTKYPDELGFSEDLYDHAHEAKRLRE